MQIYFLYIVSIIIWGTTWIAIKFQLELVNPIVSVFYRYAIAFLILFVYCIIKKEKIFRYSLKDHFIMILLGFFLFSINYWLVYLAEQELTSGLVAVLFAFLVFMNVFNGFIFMKLKINIKVIIGAIIGIIGIVLIFLPEILSFGFTKKEFIALTIGLISVFLASVGNIISAISSTRGIPVLHSNTFGMAYGTLLMLIISLIAGCEFIIPTTTSYIISLFYLAIFGSIVAFGTYLTLVSRVGADKASYVIMVVPVVALIISTLFEDYQWTIESFIGIFLVMFGNLFLKNKKTYKNNDIREVTI